MFIAINVIAYIINQNKEKFCHDCGTFHVPKTDTNSQKNTKNTDKPILIFAFITYYLFVSANISIN